MVKALMIFLIALFFSPVAKGEQLTPETFVTLQGPCYTPGRLHENLEKNEFDLIATGRSVNGSGVEATVLFYQSDRQFVIAIRSPDRICVIITGVTLDAGI